VTVTLTQLEFLAVVWSVDVICFDIIEIGSYQSIGGTRGAIAKTLDGVSGRSLSISTAEGSGEIRV
jgi:hypothetical protein